MDKFDANLTALDEMMLHLRREAKKFNLDEKTIYKMELACEEAIVNIISYAYPKKKGQLALECEQKGCRFEITIRDWGVPFNPIDVEINPQVDAPIDERHIGGLGIYLLRKVIDEVSYHREGDENVLRLVYTHWD
ncbi:MAG: Serine-protein kinase RsbW [Chlamydiales bacterium]|nr:Serine-protein kinase RsbW [Chlamydiales bacterium]